MPGPAFHLLVALDTLQAIRRSGCPVDFSLDDTESTNSFLCGSLGPDMGYHPGAERLTADLAHYVHTGELVRNLFRNATTSIFRAYAWGWLSHLLVDVRGHPLINRAVAERLKGNRQESISYEEDPSTHLLVESALDAIWSFRGSRLNSLVLKSVWNFTTVEVLAKAFEQTYGVRFQSRTLLRTHRASLWGTRWFLRLDQIRGACWTTSPRSFRARLLEWAVLIPGRVTSFLMPRTSLLRVLTNPDPPADWLVQETKHMIPQVIDDFMNYFRHGLDRLPDYNLDLGVVEDPSRRSKMTSETLERLIQRTTTI